jgi:hypothetical protein
MTNKPEELVKRLYNTPRVERYGNLRDLTRAVANTSKNLDGGINGKQKTS